MIEARTQLEADGGSGKRRKVLYKCADCGNISDFIVGFVIVCLSR